MSEQGNIGIDHIFAYPGNPTGVNTAIFNPEQGDLIIDPVTPRLYQKTTPKGDNSGYAEVTAGGGGIIVQNPDGSTTEFSPEADTDAAREAALRLAIAAAVDNSVITLVAFRATVTTTALSADLTGGVTGVKIVFGEGSALVYDDPENATYDRLFFAGPRNVVNFGAVADNVTDNLPFFNAAYNSLDIPTTGNVDRRGRYMRSGIVLIPIPHKHTADTTYIYRLSGEFVIGAGVSLHGESSSVCAIGFLDNTAPSNIANMPTIGTTSAVISGDSFTMASHGMCQAERIAFQTEGTLPTEITAGTSYYVIVVDANTFKVAATPGGDVITLSGSPTNVHTVKRAELFAVRLLEGNSVNTTHSWSMQSFAIEHSTTGNGRCSGIWAMGAQNCWVRDIVTGYVAQRPFVGNPQVMDAMWITHADVGPLLELFQASTNCGQLSIEHIGVDSGLTPISPNLDEDGDEQPAILLRNCSGAFIQTAQGEGCNTMVKIKDSQFCRVGYVVSNSVPYWLQTGDGTGFSEVIITGNSYGNSIGSFAALGYQNYVLDRNFTFTGKTGSVGGATTWREYSQYNQPLHCGGITTGFWLPGREENGESVAGNARGAGAVDLQVTRNQATQVASGYSSFMAGEYNTVGASARGAAALGRLHSVTHALSTAVGASCVSRMPGQFLQGSFASDQGDFRLQRHVSLLGAQTTNDTPTELYYNTYAKEYLVVPSGIVYACRAVITGVQSGLANAARYERQFLIQNSGGTTALVGTVQTVGTDIESDAAWDVAITADDTNDRVAVTVTGVAATTIKWHCMIEALEVQP